MNSGSPAGSPFSLNSIVTSAGSEPELVARMLRGDLECAALSIDGLREAAQQSGAFKVLGNGPSTGSRTGAVICAPAALEAYTPSQRSALQGVFIRLGRAVVPYGARVR